MLKIYNLNELTKSKVQDLCQRNIDSDHSISSAVENIISTVREKGDEALRNFAKQFDRVDLEKLYLEESELASLAESVADDEKKAIITAYNNIKKFHESQIFAEPKVETTPGVTCWRENRAIERVGLYIPGGTAVLPSTFLMLGIPAKLAGCKQIVVCSPPQKDGKINGYLAFSAQLLGIDKIFLAGGAQAVAAMAYGTESIPKVDKIYGPGNQFVTRAKTFIQANSQTAIDMPAGPSEVLVIADESANPVFVAADMLAQCEHGIDSQAVLVSTSTDLITKTIRELQLQIQALPRAEIAAKAISNSYALLVDDLSEAMNFSNEYAPEHLILATDQWETITESIINAGSVFLGHLTPESVGDYASGTNHTLPTSSYAKAYSGVSVDSFVKKITFQHITQSGIKNLGPTVEILANMEQLQAHKNAVSVRLK
ncbi:histidinol dehydrogenase [Daejeonella oryzae]|uniref:histidinol dehydrogenase n=1 Tax=Daejeonella oryzae TaxID=1122943 RepID=UPI0003F87297|nr:histidinol dehydrogenase [Daejeonella oryzae]